MEITDRYDIRLAQLSDYEALVEFIDRHWRKDHIFCTSRKLLDWQHLNRKSQEYNFIVGVERSSGELQGILGFIPLNQYDEEIERSRLVWMVIWKVKEEARGHKLGRHLMSYLEELTQPTIMSTVAATSMTLAMYQARGFQTGTLHQYYILNSSKSSYELVTIGASEPRPAINSSIAGRSLVQVVADSLDDFEPVFQAQEELPRKTPRYIVNRYARHPIFRYQTYAIHDDRKPIGLIVTRTCHHSGARALRIVEFVGPATALHGLEEEWQRLLEAEDAEYIDFYNAGIDDSDLRMSGFRRRVSAEGTVVPHYYEPFAKQNVDIDFVIRLPAGKSYRIVKGDSDQDRPSMMGTPTE